MSRCGAQLVLVTVLGLVLWTMTGADASGDMAAGGTGSGTSSAEELAVHLAGGSVGGQATSLVRAPHDRSGGAARTQRLLAIVAVLVGGALAVRPRLSTRSGHHALPVWSGWFADPGHLRGPPVI